MQANISLQMNKIKKYKKRRYLNDNGVKIVLLVVSFPDLGNRNASDAPIISIDFIDNDNSRLFVFTEHVVQQIGKMCIRDRGHLPDCFDAADAFHDHKGGDRT